MKLQKEIVVFDKSVHERSNFDCGNQNLNNYLQRYLSQNVKKQFARAYVVLQENSARVLGYYTLSAGSIGHVDLPESSQTKVPKYPVPVLMLGRLASDKECKIHNLRVGEKLLVHAIKTSLQLSRQAGVYALVVEAKSGSKGFYEKYNFMPLNKKGSHYYLPIQTIFNLFE